jgi:glycosyltransferase involved in cell wall biosynthesis
MITILLPIYNGIEFINESVGSVLSQTYSDWELLIGVNGYIENSNVYQKAKEYEKKDNRIKVFDFYNIKGKANTLNELVKYVNVKCDFVALIDVDDVWNYRKLQIQSQILRHYDVIGSNCVWFGDRNGIIPAIPTGNISSYYFSQVNPIINSSVIIRKELSWWDPRFVLDDYDLWIRLRKQNKKFYNCKDVLVKHRIHKESAFNSKGNHNHVPALLKYHYGK